MKPSQKAEEFVREYMNSKLSQSIYFHNFGHILSMKKEVLDLSKSAKLTREDRENILIAVLFLDIGYCESYTDVALNSKRIATDFFRKEKYSVEKINVILTLMSSCSSADRPSGTLQKLIYDVCYSYYGEKKFLIRLERLYKEEKVNSPRGPQDHLIWMQDQLEQMRKLHYASKSGIKKYEYKKMRNVEKLEGAIAIAEKKEAKRIRNFSIADNKAATSMFKTSLRNHIDLTAIADQKSNIMLSVSALLMTIGTPLFASMINDDLYLIIPTILFAITCIATMILATMSTRPIKMDGETNLDNINLGKTNLFFFGNFYNIGHQEYTDAIKKVITDKDNLDSSIINDLYFLGQSLGDKFRYLRMCYNVFIGGLILSLLVLIISYLLIG
ncbi:MAG: hypothetical protein ACI9P5_002853 [Saprospiraceae bacterium]|jgi:hypothetical protein